MRTALPSASFAVYRAPAVLFGGMSDGIAAARRADGQFEQTVKSLKND
jgi:hypothetical protein